MILFSQSPQSNIISKNISSSFFQYSDRTIASTVTNDTSAESSLSQLLGARQIGAWHDQEGATPTFRMSK